MRNSFRLKHFFLYYVVALCAKIQHSRNFFLYFCVHLYWSNRLTCTGTCPTSSTPKLRSWFRGCAVSAVVQKNFLLFRKVMYSALRPIASAPLWRTEHDWRQAASRPSRLEPRPPLSILSLCVRVSINHRRQSLDSHLDTVSASSPIPAHSRFSSRRCYVARPAE